MQVPHDREGDHLAQRVAFGEDHHQPVDAHAAAGGRRVAVLDRARVLLVVGVGHVGVVDHPALALVDEALPLVDRVVELGVAADELDPADDGVEVLAELWVHGVALADRERLEREVEDMRRLVYRRLDLLAVDVGDHLRPGRGGVHRFVEDLGELVSRGRRACPRPKRSLIRSCIVIRRHGLARSISSPPRRITVRPSASWATSRNISSVTVATSL